MRRDLLFVSSMVILLVALLLLIYLMTASSGHSAETVAHTADNWTVSGLTGELSLLEYSNLFFGGDGTVYTVGGKFINAIGPDGRIEWNVTIPNIAGYSQVKSWYSYHAITDNGTLYIQLLPTGDGLSGNGEFLAVSPQGKILWQTNDSPMYFSAQDGRLYAWDHNVTVYYRNGTVAWTADDANPALVDATDTAYTISGSGSTLSVYDANGHIKTAYNLTDFGLGPLMEVYSLCPQIYYNDHMVYVPLQYGMVALSDGGAFKWKSAYSDNHTTPLFWNEQFDVSGNTYLRNLSKVYYITPDGEEHLLTDNYSPYWQGVTSGSGLASVEDGAYYTIRTISATYGTDTNGDETSAGDNMSWFTSEPGNRSLGLLDKCVVTAYDIKTGATLWNLTLPTDEHMVNVTKNEGPVKSYSLANSRILDGTLYVNYWADNTEVDGGSGYAYAGGIYAVNKNGSLEWYKPTGSQVYYMDEIGGRIIYCTADGNISSFKPA
jgi:hypothetical protein